MPARSVRFEHEHVEPFRCAVHGGCETGRARADDHQVAHVGLLDGVVETEALGDPLVARVLQHRIAAADQYRDLVRGRFLWVPVVLTFTVLFCYWSVGLSLAVYAVVLPFYLIPGRTAPVERRSPLAEVAQ